MLTGIHIGDPRKRPLTFDFNYEKWTMFRQFFPTQGENDVHSGAIKISWITSFIEKNKDDPMIRPLSTRAFIFFIMAELFFPNSKSTNRLGYLAAITDLDRLDDYDWGSAILGALYMAPDAYSLGVKGLCGWWSLLEYWYYEYFANLHLILQDEATNDARLYFPRLTRWKRINLMEKVNREMHNNVSIARVQIELRRKGYLSMFQAFRMHGIWGSGALFRDRYLDQLRGQGWVDGEQFLIKHISYDLYWARVSTPYILPDYSRMIKADVIGPRAVRGWIIPSRFAHSMPQEIQLTHEDMATSTDPSWRLRVVDIDGIDRLLDVPHLSDVPGVPSAGLYNDTEVNG
ncbi:hypothetical protein GIB67_034155 [Kingdonia uniflora]|uniref:Aminotransferase-like plant mobile domain-containing protein n=1 Tax=Kingdonia uniflora TaxID=39325 RepID=A0A7J7LRV1_9MAGN|nr:hypothetical protein GIB67_034155 [Kingdonia uniflora]